MPETVTLEVEWSNFAQLEQQLLHAVSQLPKVKVDELRITMGRSARGIYLRFDVLPLDEKDLNNKGVSCQLKTCAATKCIGLEYEGVGLEKRSIGIQTAE